MTLFFPIYPASMMLPRQADIQAVGGLGILIALTAATATSGFMNPALFVAPRVDSIADLRESSQKVFRRDARGRKARTHLLT